MCIKFEIFKKKIRKIFEVFNEKQLAKKSSLIFNTTNVNRRIRRAISKTNKFNKIKQRNINSYISTKIKKCCKKQINKK